jgi:hypothetical protein
MAENNWKALNQCFYLANSFFKNVKIECFLEFLILPDPTSGSNRLPTMQKDA